MVEVLGQPASASARVSQVMVEVVNQIVASTSEAIVSQVMVEAVISIAPARPGGGSGRWFYDLWFEDELWREEDVRA